jgi:MOSC domain-containing protein YiiM
MSTAATAPRVVSVNVGTAKTVEWHGRNVTSAIWKSPVDAPVVVEHLALHGDEQADLRVHGGPDKAVYAYSVDDYTWWSAQLGVTLGPGTFGENLTIADIDVSRAVVGQEWEVGDAVLRVTQPRMPCFKLGMRMGDASFVDRFGAALRPGAYLRVVRPGRVRAGDAVIVGAPPAQGLTVRDIADAYAHHDGELVRRLATAPDVPPSWSEWAQHQLEREPT